MVTSYFDEATSHANERYIPLELLEVLPQQLHWRAPAYAARSDLESLLASDAAADWVCAGLPPRCSLSNEHASLTCMRTSRVLCMAPCWMMLACKGRAICCVHANMGTCVLCCVLCVRQSTCTFLRCR
jgi:hypothetical protein